jgi:hypothetical protein
MSIVWRNDAKCAKASIMRSRTRHQVYFTQKKYGSKEKAILAAKMWVSKLEKELPERSTIKNIKTARNKSGVVGVRLDPGKNRKHGKLHFYPRWIAFWPGLQGGIPWSIGLNKYSDDDAFVLAYLSRKYESKNRDKVLKEFYKIRHTKEHREILALKRQ